LVGAVGEEPTGEARERREAHGAEHAVGVHVANPLVDVEATGTDLREARRFDAVLLLRATGDGVQPHVGDLGALVQPDIGVVVLVHDARRAVLPHVGEVLVEQVRWLDDVVVDADEDQIFELHGWLSARRLALTYPNVTRRERRFNERNLTFTASFTRAA